MEDTLARLQCSSHDAALAAVTQTGMMPVHRYVANMMVGGDTRRSQELERYEDVPATATWGLMTPSAYCFDDPNSRFRVAPTRLPQRHLSGTPDVVEGSTFLPTTHAALCGMEELERAGVLNASLLLHMIDEAENTVLATARANEVLTSKISDLATAKPTSDEDAERQRELKAAAKNRRLPIWRRALTRSCDFVARQDVSQRTLWTRNKLLFTIDAGRYCREGNAMR